jgi:hypothetical protein
MKSWRDVALEENRRITLLHYSSTPLSRALRLVAETLLMATLLHALAALVLGNFRFASFFERAHSDFLDSRAAIQPSNPLGCNSLLCCGIEDTC